jgi:predicted AAA+ superfamily ATPase
MYHRKQIFTDSQNESLFLWGARQTGKSTLLKELFPDALWFDLLLSDVYERLLRNPSLLRETIDAGQYEVIIIDEIQRIPELLNEVHWIITHLPTRVIMSGTSHRNSFCS